MVIPVIVRRQGKNIRMPRVTESFRLPTVTTYGDCKPDESRRFTYKSRTIRGTHATERQEYCASLRCGNVGTDFCCMDRRPRKPKPFDVVILHGHIIDGTGSPWYSGDVGIRDGHIAAIGDLGAAPAKQKIDAQGKVVAPGFIDMLGQSELTILVDPRLPSKIYQGITTEITGEGNSVGAGE